jgi:adenylate cyclase class IV
VKKIHVRIRELLQEDLCAYKLHEQTFYNTGGIFYVEKITETGGSFYQCCAMKIKESSDLFTQENIDAQKIEKNGYNMLQKNLENFNKKKIKKSCTKFAVDGKVEFEKMTFQVFIDDVSNLGLFLRVSVPVLDFYNKNGPSIKYASTGITDLMKKLGFERWVNSPESYADLMIKKEGKKQ